MALLVWLPLNKENDFKNRGLADITVTNSGASYNSSGKIGGCCLCNPDSSTHSGGYLLTNIKTSNIISESGSFSLCCWVKRTASGYSNGCGLIASNNYKNYGFGLYLRTNGLFDFMMCDASLEKEWMPSTTAIVNDIWYHICVTYNSNGRKQEMYINGDNVASDTISFDWKHSSMNINIGTGTQGGWEYSLPGCLNDIRIYDHCLSPKEVKEISKGLVLHYPLNDYVGNNLASNTTWERTSSNEYMLILNTYTDAGTGEYTFSCWMKVASGTPSVNIYFSDGNYTKKYSYTVSDIYVNNTLNGKLSLEWQRVVCKLTFTTSTADSTVMPHVSTYYTYGSGAIVSVKNPKLEKGWNPNTVYSVNGATCVYDSSGYENNGTITGTLTTSTDTPRYDKCTTFNTSSYITSNNPFSGQSAEQNWTITCWVKTNSLNNNIKINNFNNNNYISGNNSYQPLLYVSLSNYMYSKTAMTNNNWIHFAFVYNANSNIRKVYMNGVNVSGYHIENDTTAQTLSSTINWITGLDGNVSDLRMYATNLTDDDIQELYNTSAFITDNGTVEAYLFEESPNLVNMLKTEQEGITTKLRLGHLSFISQTNCSCTLEDEGYRIYRNPNNTKSGKRSKNLGGFVINNYNNALNLQDNHTYLLEFDIKGISDSAATDICWNWQTLGDGELVPKPTNVIHNNPYSATTHQSDVWEHYSYKFTLSDGLYKTCTTSYNSNSAVAGTTYLSYKYFEYGWTYTTTGSSGTDVYINNLRMYDITTETPIQLLIEKSGEMLTTAVIENNDNAFVDSYGEINSNQLIEI